MCLKRVLCTACKMNFNKIISKNNKKILQNKITCVILLAKEVPLCLGDADKIEKGARAMQEEGRMEDAGVEKIEEEGYAGQTLQTAAQPGERLLSVAMAAAGYLYVSVFGIPTRLGQRLSHSRYLGGYTLTGVCLFLFTGLFLAVGLACVRAGKRALPRAGWGYFALTIAAALWFPIYLDSDQDVYFFMLLFLHGAAVYWLMAVSGRRSGEYLDERGIADLGRGFFVLPFRGYLRIFAVWGGLFQQAVQGKQKEGRHGRQVVLGVAISLPVLAVVAPMLMAADEYFLAFAKHVLAGLGGFWKGWRWSLNGLALIFTMLAACYLYGLFYRAFYRPAACVRAEKRLCAPQTVMGSFLVPLVLLYLVFFLVRLLGVAGAMEQIAGGGLRISAYAREGFFELCRLAAVNLLVFGLARWYSPEAGKGVRLLLGGLGIETLLFIVLAFSKMWYYIESYRSFTFKRAMCCWFLVTLFVLFSCMTAELWQRRIKGVRAGVIFGCVSFLAMAYSNMPAWAP